MRRLFLLLALCCSVMVQAANYSLLVEWPADQSAAQRQAQQQAMLLFIDMVPTGSQASIWLYADQVQNIQANATVGPAWRAQARSAVSSVPNLGLGSQLGKALDQIQQQPSGPGARHLLLLSDGQLRGLGDSPATIRERNRILQQQLPLFRQSGVQVHSISLAPVDEQLLQFLALRTNGQFQSLQRPEQLPIALARALQLSMASHELPELPLIATPTRPVASPIASPVASPQTSPRPAVESVAQAESQQRQAQDRQVSIFNLDAQTQQLLLWLEHPEPERISLLSPEQERIEWDTQRPDVQWRRLDQWQLVILQQPLPGEWQLEHSLPQSPIVELVTDLQLLVSGLGSVYAPGQSVHLELQLNQQTEQALSYEVRAIHLETGQELSFDLEGDNRAVLPGLTIEGEWLIRAQASLPGIERVRIWPVRQQSPLAVELQSLPQGVQLQLLSLSADLDPFSSRVSMELRGPVSQVETSMTPVMDGFAAFVAAQEVGLYQVRFSGTLRFEDQDIEWQSAWYQWQLPLEQVIAQPEELPEAQISPAVQPEDSAVTEPSLDLSVVPEPEPQAASSARYWLYVLAILPGVIFLAFMFWVYKRIERKLAANAPLVDEHFEKEAKQESQQAAAGLAGIDLAMDGQHDTSSEAGVGLSDLPDLDEQLQEESLTVAGDQQESEADPSAGKDTVLDEDLISLSETQVSSNRQEDLQQVDELQKSLDELASQYEDEELSGLDVGDEELDLDSLDAAWFESGQDLPEAESEAESEGDATEEKPKDESDNNKT